MVIPLEIQLSGMLTTLNLKISLGGKLMKGIILAGGKGTRLYPLTKKVNKHFLPVGNEPMIFNPIKQLISCNIEDIMIVTNSSYMEAMKDLLKKGNFPCNFYLKAQELSKGISHALLLCKEFVAQDSMVVILGDNIVTHSINKYVNNFNTENFDAKILLKEVPDPKRFAVAYLKNGNITKIIEKPSVVNSIYAVTGIYMYTNTVFDIIKSLRPSKRGELEITPVNSIYLKQNKLSYEILKDDWVDAGTFDSYEYANKLLLNLNNTILDGDNNENSI